jgi:hypothetical protein
MKSGAFLIVSIILLGTTYFLPAPSHSPFSKSHGKSVGASVQVDFSRHPLPGYVVATTNIAASEGWGRWMDGSPATIHFSRPLPRRMLVTLDSGCVDRSEDTAVEIRVAQSAQVIPVDTCQRRSRSIVLENPTGGSSLEIHMPTLFSPSRRGVSKDTRNLGLSLFTLEVADAP